MAFIAIINIEIKFIDKVFNNFNYLSEKINIKSGKVFKKI
jgi:hypothetical protein